MIKNKDSGYDHAIFLKTRNIDVIQKSNRYESESSIKYDEDQIN